MNDQVSYTVAVGGASATALAFFSDSLTHMIPWLIAAVPLIILDLRFGIRAAKHRGEKIRLSTAFRRTFGKAVEYFCWIVLAATLSLAFQKAWIEWAVLGVVVINEFASIIGNFLETKGLEISWPNVFRALFHFGAQKAGLDDDGIDPNGFVRPIQKPKPQPIRNEKGQFVSRRK